MRPSFRFLCELPEPGPKLELLEVAPGLLGRAVLARCPGPDPFFALPLKLGLALAVVKNDDKSFRLGGLTFSTTQMSSSLSASALAAALALWTPSA